MKHMTHRLSGGFTLIELLVVISIIGIIATVTLAALSVARSKAHIAATAETLSSLRAAVNICCGRVNPGQLLDAANPASGAVEMCSPTNDVTYPSAEELRGTSVNYEVLGQCSMAGGTGYISVQLTGHPDPGCNYTIGNDATDWEVHESYIKKPDACK